VFVRGSYSIVHPSYRQEQEQQNKASVTESFLIPGVMRGRTCENWRDPPLAS
jgi:hypothetical protein